LPTYNIIYLPFQLLHRHHNIIWRNLIVYCGSAFLKHLVANLLACISGNMTASSSSVSGKRKRGSYKRRATKPIILDPFLDAIVDRDETILPDLAIIQPSTHDAQPTMLEVGKDRNTNTPVWMMPIHRGGSDSHVLKFYTYDENHKMSEPGLSCIVWKDAVYALATFNTPSAVSRWSTSPVRQTQHRTWLLFVWERITGEDLPTGAVTSKRKCADVAADDTIASIAASTNEDRPPLKLRQREKNDSALPEDAAIPQHELPARRDEASINDNEPNFQNVRTEVLRSHNRS
jgi:hypothetical protein